MWRILCIFIIILKSVAWFLKCKEFQVIPGPRGIFILHNALEFMMDPVKLFYYFRGLTNTYKRLFKLQLGPVKVIIIHNPEDIEAVINGTKYISKGYVYNFIKPWLKEGLILSKGKKWHVRRKMITPAFHFNVLNNFKLVIEKNARNLLKFLDRETKSPKTDISPLLHNFTLNTICETAMGITIDEESTQTYSVQEYKRSIHKLGQYAVYRAQRVWLYPDFVFNLTNIGRKQKKVLRILSSFRTQVVDKRREQNLDGQEDFKQTKKSVVLLDILLQAERDRLIDSEGIGEEVDTFMFGGHDTTSIALTFIFLLLANHQNVQEKIVDELNNVLSSFDGDVTTAELLQMKYMECCIKESLRLYPPIPAITRNIDVPLKLRDYEIPSGTECGILIYDLHRRSDQFVEPLEFRPERFQTEPTWQPYGYIPFSAGPRNCIGQKFAMMEMKLAVTTVLRRFRLLPVTTPRDLIITTDYVLRTKHPVYVKFQKRY
ncbi:cytochrome P450 4C1-like [Pieris rapae]|uniref:cytochrome P450 4C1-like n=1 Tax=Pieris rapae TaxID=64459 RepID=UPI001E27A87A|nr:cytochrome P450 4C1-like [Pieris rapae]